MRCIRNAFVVAFLATLFLALFGALAAPAEAGIREATVKVRNPTIDRFGRIIQEDCGSATAVLRESGTLWYAGCGHNFHGAIGGKFTIEAWDGSTAVATLERFDKTSDLALFSSRDYAPIDTIPIGLEPSSAKMGIAAGYPGAGEFRETYVTFLPARWADEAGHPQLDMVCKEPMPQGVSGGPIIINGELHGVISTGSATVPGDSGLMACTQQTLRDFVSAPVQKCTNGRCRLIDILRGRRKANAGQGQPTAQPANGKPLRPIAHAEPLPPPPAHPAPAPAPSPEGGPPGAPPGLTADFLRSELARLEGNLKGHTSQEADRLGGIAIGGLSNAKDQIKADLQAGIGKLASDPNAVKRIEDALGKLSRSPDAAAIAEKVIAGIPAAAPIVEAGASVLGIGSIATGVGAPLGIAVFLAQLLGSWMHSRAIGKLGTKPSTNQNSQSPPPSPPATAGAECPAPEHHDAPPPQIVQVKVADPLGEAMQQATANVLRDNPDIPLIEAQPLIEEVAQTILKLRKPFTKQPASTGALVS